MSLIREWEKPDWTKKLWGNDHRLLLGVTGGIASGKSTVAAMLEELGAPIIDFDILSREVVEPGRPAWQDIIDFFGEQVLSKDLTLDRARLREIVFRDEAKRKKLENFIHPRAVAEFARLVHVYAERNPEAIIQTVVPLLIEINLQSSFHHLLLVYIPEKEQVRRLIERNGFSEEMAMNIISSQLSIEKKKEYCDLILDNSGTLAETREQVGKLWEKLRDTQRRRTSR